MQVVLSKHAGFCPGVCKADETVKRLISLSKSELCRIYTLGHLIHNDIYNNDLLSQGVGCISLFDVESTFLSSLDIPMTVVIRTHGITKSDLHCLTELCEKYPTLSFIDCTCPYVKKIHRIAEENTNENTHFVLFCSPSHPEALGILSYVNGEKTAISSFDEVERIDFKGKTPILCSQTTQNLVEFKKIKKFLKKLYTNAKIFDTICSVTENRQKEAIEIARSADTMIVIGGRDSSNTKRLYELCSAECSDTRWIESLVDLNTDFRNSAKCVGITAGSSTPRGIIT